MVAITNVLDHRLGRAADGPGPVILPGRQPQSPTEPGLGRPPEFGTSRAPGIVQPAPVAAGPAAIRNCRLQCGRWTWRPSGITRCQRLLAARRLRGLERHGTGGPPWFAGSRLGRDDRRVGRCLVRRSRNSRPWFEHRPTRFLGGALRLSAGRVVAGSSVLKDLTDGGAGAAACHIGRRLPGLIPEQR